MGKWTVYQADLGKDINARAKAPYIDASSLPVKVVVELDNEVLKGIGKDPLLQQKLQDAASAAAEDCKAECVKDVEWANTMYGKTVDKFKAGTLTLNALAADVVQFTKLQETLIAKRLQDFDKDVGAAVEGAYDKWLKDNKKYKSFKIKYYVSMIGNGLKLVASTAAIALTSSVAPLSWVVFGYSTYSAIFKAFGDFKKYRKDFDSITKSIEDNTKQLRDDYDKLIKEGKSSTLSAKELLKGVAKAVMIKIPGLDKYVEKLTKSSKSLLRDVGFAEQKLREWDLDAHQASREFAKLLKQIDTKALPPEMAADGKALEKAIDDSIAKIGEFMKKIDDGGKRLDAVKVKLKEIAQMKEGWAVALELVIEFARDDIPMLMGIGAIGETIQDAVSKGMDLIMALKKADERFNDTKNLKKLAS